MMNKVRHNDGKRTSSAKYKRLTPTTQDEYHALVKSCLISAFERGRLVGRRDILHDEFDTENPYTPESEEQKNLDRLMAVHTL